MVLNPLEISTSPPASPPPPPAPSRRVTGRVVSSRPLNNNDDEEEELEEVEITFNHNDDNDGVVAAAAGKETPEDDPEYDVLLSSTTTNTGTRTSTSSSSSSSSRCGCGPTYKIGRCTILCPTLYQTYGFGMIGPHWYGPLCTIGIIWGVTAMLVHKAWNHASLQAAAAAASADSLHNHTSTSSSTRTHEVNHASWFLVDESLVPLAMVVFATLCTIHLSRTSLVDPGMVHPASYYHMVHMNPDANTNGRRVRRRRDHESDNGDEEEDDDLEVEEEGVGGEEGLALREGVEEGAGGQQQRVRRTNQGQAAAVAAASSLPPPPPRRRREGDWRWCDVCRVHQPPRAVHCPDCHVCIDFYDHHCPWMGTCVGRGNMKSFMMFNITWLLYLLFVVAWMMIDGAITPPAVSVTAAAFGKWGGMRNETGDHGG